MLRWHLAIFPWIIGNKNETWWKTIEPPVGKAFIIERIVQWGSIGLWAPYTKTLVDKNQDARAVLWCSIVWIDEKLVSQEGKQTRPAVDSFFTSKKTIHAHKNTDLKLLVQIKIIAHFYFQLSARLLIFCEALLMYLTTPLLRLPSFFFCLGSLKIVLKWMKPLIIISRVNKPLRGNKNKIDAGTTGDRNPC